MTSRCRLLTRFAQSSTASTEMAVQAPSNALEGERHRPVGAARTAPVLHYPQQTLCLNGKRSGPGRAAYPGWDLGRTQGPAEPIALHHVAAQRAQPIERRFVLDAFG